MIIIDIDVYIYYRCLLIMNLVLVEKYVQYVPILTGLTYNVYFASKIKHFNVLGREMKRTAILCHE